MHLDEIRRRHCGPDIPLIAHGRAGPGKGGDHEAVPSAENLVVEVRTRTLRTDLRKNLSGLL